MFPKITSGPIRRVMCFLVAVTCFSRGVAGETTSELLAAFQEFVNGHVPVKEAVVYRRISGKDGKTLNQEWWRFGYEDGSWFVQRLVPDSKEPAKLIPLPGDTVVGASYDEVWTIGDKDMHVAAIKDAKGSKPDTFGELPRSLLYCALSLGVPRRLDFFSIEDSPVTWTGVQFTSIVGTKSDAAGNVVAAGAVTGQLELGPSGLPRTLSYAGVGSYPAGIVTYEYGDLGGALLPSRFVVSYDGRQLAYEFLAVTLGTNDVRKIGGYMPGMFAAERPARHYTFWTNDLPYSLLAEGLHPAFGGHRTRTGTLILATVGAGCAVTLALWYRRSQKTANKLNSKNNI